MIFLKLLFFGAAFFFGFRIVKPWLSKHISIHISNGDKEEIEDVMVKDPCCETYFPKRDGVYAHISGQDFYFCSKECRDKYLEKLK